MDAGGLEEELGAMHLTAAGTREGFTMLQLTTALPGMSCWPSAPFAFIQVFLCHWHHLLSGV